MPLVRAFTPALAWRASVPVVLKVQGCCGRLLTGSGFLSVCCFLFPCRPFSDSCTPLARCPPPSPALTSPTPGSTRGFTRLCCTAAQGRTRRTIACSGNLGHPSLPPHALFCCHPSHNPSQATQGAQKWKDERCGTHRDRRAAPAIPPPDAYFRPLPLPPPAHAVPGPLPPLPSSLRPAAPPQVPGPCAASLRPCAPEERGTGCEDRTGDVREGHSEHRRPA